MRTDYSRVKPHGTGLQNPSPSPHEGLDIQQYIPTQKKSRDRRRETPPCFTITLPRSQIPRTPANPHLTTLWSNVTDRTPSSRRRNASSLSTAMSAGPAFQTAVLESCRATRRRWLALSVSGCRHWTADSVLLLRGYLYCRLVVGKYSGQMRGIYTTWTQTYG